MAMHRIFIAVPLFLLAATFSATPSRAQAARVITVDPKANVVIIAVSKVNMPSAMPGLCQVNGTVSEVLDGSGLRIGQTISLPVPCGVQGLRPLIPAAGEAQLIDPQVLQKSKRGIAHLTNAGTLIWGATPKSYGTFGPVSGYRVYDGVILPLNKHS